MDQLDILKQNWQSQTSDAPRFTKDQLGALLAKRSSSIVKRLFIIAVIEFAFFIVLGMACHLHNQSSDIDVIGQMGKLFYHLSLLKIIRQRSMTIKDLIPVVWALTLQLLYLQMSLKKKSLMK